MNKIPTIKVVADTESGYMIINSCDKTDSDKLFDEEGASDTGLTASEIKVQLDELGVEYKGNASKTVLAELLEANTE